jgi:LPXTG-motif cell wall-anchored protein
MIAIGAVRETEAWSGASVVAGLLLLALVVGWIFWRVRRFLQGR